MKLALLLVLGVFVQACGTIKYTPEEYKIANDRVNDLNVKGQVLIVNGQLDSTEKIFFDGSTDFVGDYKSVTEHLKKQLGKELAENTSTTSNGDAKLIEVKVVNIATEQKPFHFVSAMDVEYKLGNSEFNAIHVSQGSPGNMWRVLNGTIALGVIEILNNDKVKDYLAH